MNVGAGLPKPQASQVIKLAILAVGGQGGGVLAGWITDLATRCGWHVQSTSVAGVAQRTGATIYYVEMAPRAPERPDAQPVFALSPSPGDVDIVIAAELVEAGRAIMRGFVTQDRTTLIASSHRLLAVSEKTAPGDSRAEAGRIIESAEQAAARFVHFDMESIALAAGSVVSASLFGALAGAGVLPFPRAAFEDTIRAGERGIDPSLAAFAAGQERAAGGAVEDACSRHSARQSISGPGKLLSQWDALQARLAALPALVVELAGPGLSKVVDFLDCAYGTDYLDRLERALEGDSAEKNFSFSREAAKYLANAMVYDDIIRVADLKTRGSRVARVRHDVLLSDDQSLRVTEYFHPRMEEICGTLPAALGAAIEARPRLMAALDRVVDRGRRIRTDRILGFGLLWMIAGIKQRRRHLLRHRVESAHLEEWFALALRQREADYDLGAEVLKCRRLIKGYSDTHKRGLSKFDQVLSVLSLLQGRKDAADWIRRLRDAALADAEGAALEGAILTVRSFAQGDDAQDTGARAIGSPNPRDALVAPGLRGLTTQPRRNER